MSTKSRKNFMTPEQCAEQFENYAASNPSRDSAHSLRFCANFLREFCIIDSAVEVNRLRAVLARIADGASYPITEAYPNALIRCEIEAIAREALSSTPEQGPTDLPKTYDSLPALLRAQGAEKLAAQLERDIAEKGPTDSEMLDWLAKRTTGVLEWPDGWEVSTHNGDRFRDVTIRKAVLRAMSAQKEGRETR